MPDCILVINPNSTDAVTRAIDDAMAPLRITGGPGIDMGVGQRLAGDLAIGLGVTELADAPRTLSRMIDVGRRLHDQHGADVLVMGCAGMARTAPISKKRSRSRLSNRPKPPSQWRSAASASARDKACARYLVTPREDSHPPRCARHPLRSIHL
jgi:hypothetical protein